MFTCCSRIASDVHGVVMRTERGARAASVRAARAGPRK